MTDDRKGRTGMSNKTGKKIFNTPIEILNLSFRTYNALKIAGYYFIEQLDEIISKPVNIIAVGSKELTELKEKLFTYYNSDIFKMQNLFNSLSQEDQNRSLRLDIEDLTKGLSGRQKHIIYLRYGIKNLTLQKTGEKLGVTRERVRQVEKQGIIEIRSNILNSIDLSHLIYIKSALKIFSDMKDEASITKWISNLCEVHDFNQNEVVNIDNEKILYSEWLVALVAFLSKKKIIDLAHFQAALKYPEKMVGSLYLSNNFPKEEFRAARRTSKNGGAFYLPMIAKRVKTSDQMTKEAFEILGYQEIAANWMAMVFEDMLKIQKKSLP